MLPFEVLCIKIRFPVYKMDSTEELIRMGEFVYRILLEKEKERERERKRERDRER